MQSRDKANQGDYTELIANLKKLSEIKRTLRRFEDAAKIEQDLISIYK